MSIVRSNGTLVKNDFSSNNTISYPAGMGSFFYLLNEVVCTFDVVFYSLNGDSTFDRCLANWYGLIRRSSILPLAGNLCNFAVP